MVKTLFYGVKGLVAKLTHKQAKPPDRTVKSVVLKALATEPEYKIGIEVIKQTQPNITLDDLWTTVGRFTYPIKSEESVFMAKNKLTSTKSDMIASGRRLSNRHGDNNDDRHRKFDHSECYEKPQRPEQSEKPRGNNEKHDIAFTEERCYTCQRGHKYYECLESQVSDGSNTER